MTKILNPEAPIEVHFDELVILPEIEESNIQRTDDELINLENQIRNEGKVRDPVIVWEQDGKLILADGFSRRRAIKKLHEEEDFSPMISAYSMDFANLEVLKFWVRMNQDTRRNLNDDQRSYYIGSLYTDLQDNKESLRNYLSAIGRNDLEEELEEGGVGLTSRILGEVYKVSFSSVKRNAAYFKGVNHIKVVNPVLADAILRQEVYDDKAERVKVNRSLIEKIGTEKPRISKKVQTFQDLQASLAKEKERARQEEADSEQGIADRRVQRKEQEVQIKSAVKEFLREPTLESQKMVAELLEKYQTDFGKVEEIQKVA